MRLTGLFLYPVKSLRGCAVPHATVDELGLAGDRRFLVVDEAGRFLTQRTLPAMARIETALDATTLILRTAGHGEVAVPRAPAAAATLRSVTIWKSSGLLAEDCGDEAARWLGGFLGIACRLVRIGPAFVRPVLKAAAGPGDRVHFADAVPFLAVGEASLADLNDRLVASGEEPVPMDRFRPNFVLTGGAPYEEDTWTRVRIGGITFRAAGPSVRCAIPTTDQQTGERHHEPLRTLARYRRAPASPADVIFGQNLIHETKSGELHVGDSITLLG